MNILNARDTINVGYIYDIYVQMNWLDGSVRLHSDYTTQSPKREEIRRVAKEVTLARILWRG